MWGVIVSRSIECKNGVDEEREDCKRDYREELELPLEGEN